MTFDEWWEANEMDENPYADRTESEVLWNAMIEMNERGINLEPEHPTERG